MHTNIQKKSHFLQTSPKNAPISCVVLDFTGVNVVSNSFADECIAKLLLEMPLAELRSRTTFKGLNPIANDSVLTALRRRHLTIKN